MDAARRIRRNSHKMIQKIMDGFISGKVYTLNNSFEGRELFSIAHLQNQLNNYRGSYLVYDYTKDEYTYHVHSNYWLTFKSSFQAY